MMMGERTVLRIAGLIGAVASIFVVVTLSAIAYDIWGAAPNQARADEVAWRRRCVDKGGTLIPTERHWMKVTGTYYSGWICAKIERIEP